MIIHIYADIINLNCPIASNYVSLDDWLFIGNNAAKVP